MNDKLDENFKIKLVLVSVAVLSFIIGTLLLKIYLGKPPAKRPYSVNVQTTEQKAESKKSDRPKIVLPSSLAGRWYPSNPAILENQVKGFLDKAEINKDIDNVMALILPHAGYPYSGQTAAYGVKNAQRKYKRIVIIGPTHYVAMPDTLSLPKATHYETPLGQVPLDLEFMDKLLGYSIFHNVPNAHTNEHSVQIELPFLQCSHTDFKVVPIVAGQCSLKTITKAGEILKGLLDRETLVIASSDFVHYGPNFGYVPFTQNVPENIKKLDLDAYKFIAALDYKGFLDYKRRTGTTICGYVPIAILLATLPPSAKSHLVAQTCSGEITGDFRNSVSYLSIAFSGDWPNQPEAKPDLKLDESRLSDEDKKQLLTLARKSLLHYLDKRQVLDTSELNIELSDAISENRAAFVTLKKNSQLRGCIGDLIPRQPLYKSVISNAVNAGFYDRRFLPLEKGEYDKITIEISALTPPVPVASPDEIRLGIDGIILRKEGRSAVFLPQVATEQGWNLEQTLTHLSLKARLKPDAWKNNASFLVFQAEVFGENEK
jgi:AmmeMemoRadiSam system protein B/AmmeMemoRadiSam system protein A